MKYIKSLSLLAFLILVSVMVYSIGTNSVTLESPDNATWTTLDNYTPGYNVSWFDGADPTIVNANCTLQMNTSATGLDSGGNKFSDTKIVGNNTITQIYQNKVFGNVSFRNKKLYWTITCYNDSASPKSWTPAPRVIYHDNTTPTVLLSSASFTNLSWSSNNELWAELTPTDTTDMDGFQYTCFFRNTTGNDIETGLTDNNTAVNITWTAPEGNHTFTLGCFDQANNTALAPNGSYASVAIDSTAPTVTQISPADNILIQNSTSVLLNFSVTEQNLREFNFTWNGTTTTLNLIQNCTNNGTTLNSHCTYNKTGVLQTNGINYNVTFSDAASNQVTSTTRTIQFDAGGTKFNKVFNWSVSDSVSSFTATIQDYTPTTCELVFFDSSNSNIGNLTGTIGSVTSIGQSNCTGNFNNTHLPTEGAFTVQYEITDGIGISNTTNKTGIITNLFTGWNLVGWPDADHPDSSISQVHEVCDTIKNCTLVSFYNNTAKTFTTYSTSTPGTNNGTTIAKGEPFFVYVQEASYLIANDYIPGTTSAERLVDLTTGGWNTIGLIQDGNMTGVLNLDSFNSSDEPEGTDNVTFGSWINASTSTAGTYYTCRTSINLCAGTSVEPSKVKFLKGYAVWALTDANVTINRTQISGE